MAAAINFSDHASAIRKRLLDRSGTECACAAGAGTLNRGLRVRWFTRVPISETNDGKRFVVLTPR